MGYQVGDKVRARFPIDYQPDAYIKEGETGHVAVIRDDWPDGPAVGVHWDTAHPKLGERLNITMLIEPELCCIELIEKSITGETRGILEPACNQVPA